MRRLVFVLVASAAMVAPNACGTSGGTTAESTGGPCLTTGDCSPGKVCGYLLDDLCAAKGTCIVSDCTTPDCSDVYDSTDHWCGCNGDTVVPVATDYTSAPYANQIGNCNELDGSTGTDAPSDSVAADASDAPSDGNSDVVDAQDALEESLDGGDGSDVAADVADE